MSFLNWFGFSRSQPVDVEPTDASIDDHLEEAEEVEQVYIFRGIPGCTPLDEAYYGKEFLGKQNS